MELSPKQQIAELVRNNQRILIVGHKNHGGDLLGSMLALGRVLTAQGKDVSLVLSEAIDQTLVFLPDLDKIDRDVPASDLIIQIDKSKNEIEKIAYNEDNGFINVVISPKDKLIDAKDLKIISGNYNFDLVFVLDTPDVEKIDAIYDKYTELFFEVPIINIDHHSGNEYFGTVNLVDLTATSTAEILVSIIEAMGPNNFDADVATCLLTGLIADTASFKNVNTTPKSLTISAQMLAAGARQQEIIQNLYKTRPLMTLRLWGKVLSNIEYDRDNRIVISTVGESDLLEAGASPEDVVGVLDELLASAPSTDIVLVLVENSRKLYGFLKGLNGQDVLRIAEVYGGRGRALEASFMIPNASIATHKDSVRARINQVRGGAVVQNLPQKREEVVVPKPIDSQLAKKSAEPMADMVVEVKLESENVQDLNELLSIEKSLETEISDNEPTYEELFSAKPAEKIKMSSPAAVISEVDDIDKAIMSIDTEIESGGPKMEETPNIDVEDALNKNESLRKLGEVMRGYVPGKNLDDEGKQPIDPKIWK